MTSLFFRKLSNILSIRSLASGLVRQGNGNFQSKKEFLFSSLRKMATASITDEKADEVYNKAEEYWQNASANVDGMLGGFAHLHTPDINQSNAFIRGLKTKKLLSHNEYALDCGAGIGRVTKHLLMPIFKKVDMEDVIEDLIIKSEEYIGKDSRIGEKFVEGLQTFTPPEGRYDLIWIQWVSGHLTDPDFVRFFERCKLGLRNGGCIVLKDNLASGDKEHFDLEDNSWTRTEEKILSLFEKAGLSVVSKKVQMGFPKGMYAVKMFALK